MKKLLTLLLLAAAMTPAIAQETPPPLGQRPRIGVALSGGGAKGAAHIGVLKYLEEVGIPVDYVTGTSMGSIIGGLYALGYTPDEMARLIAEMDWTYYMSNNVDRTFQSASGREQRAKYLLNVAFGLNKLSGFDWISTLPSGIINGASLINLFSRLSVGYNDSIKFSDLPIPFACVATNILNGDSVILNRGYFAKAIRSSMAIPGVFAPVEWEGKLLADGGLVNNFPVDVCLEMGADLVIGVDLSDKMATSIDEMRSLPQQISQYMSIAVNAERSRNRDLCDLYMHPDVTGYNMLSFSPESIDTMVRRGYECAKRHDAELREIKARLEAFGPCAKELKAPKARALSEADTFVLNEVDYNGISDKEESWLIAKGGLRSGIPITIADINSAISVLYGTGAFESITYRIVEAEEDYWQSHSVHTEELGLDSYNLVIDMVSAEPHRLSLGMRYDSEESAALLIHGGWNENRLSGFKAAFDLKLNYNFAANVKLAWCGLGLGDINLDYRYHNSYFYINSYDSTTMVGWIVDHHKVSLYLSEFHLRNFSFAFGLAEDFYSNRNGFSLNSLLSDKFFRFDRAKGFFDVFFKGNFDNLDNAYFPTRGSTVAINASWKTENKFLLQTSDSNFADIGFQFASFATPFSRLTFIPQASMRLLLGKNSRWYDNFMGGVLPGRYLDHQLAFIGMNNPLHVGGKAAVVRLDARYNFAKNFFLTGIVNYAVSSDKFSHFFSDQADFNDTFGAALRVSYSSFVGPLSIDLHWNSYDHCVGAYLNIGFVF